MKKILLVLLFLAATNAAFADNVKVQLDSADGTSSFIVADTLSSQVFAVNSDGNATVVNNAWAGLGANAGKMQFMDVAGTQDDIGFLNCNVGIGTTAPAYNLHILSGTTDVQLTIQGPDAEASAMWVYRTTTNDAVWGINRGGATQDLTFYLGPSAVTALHMESKGTNVGIGTTYSGAALLNVGGDITINSGSDIRPTSESANSLNITTASGADFVTFNTTTRLVGIGATNPPRKLVIYSANTQTGIAGTAIWGFKRTADNLGWIQYIDSGPGDFVIAEITNTNWNASTDRLTFERGGNVGIGTTNPANTLDVVGNFCLGNTAAGSSATRTLVFVQGTAPTTMPTDSAQLFAGTEVGSSTTTGLIVMDESGNKTQLSPHNALTGEWIFYSTNIRTGRTVRVEMEKLIKLVEKASGKRFMTETWE